MDDEGGDVHGAIAMTAPSDELRAVLWPDAPCDLKRVIACRHCGRKNRVTVETAVTEPEAHSCWQCSGPLFLARDEPFTGITASAYEHPLDRAALKTLKTLPLFPAVARWVSTHVTEPQMLLLCRSTNMECGPDQFPELLSMLDRARTALDTGFRPRLFLGESPYMNAFSGGTAEPIVVVQSALLDQLNDTEVTAVLGHELAHIQAEHGLYRWMAQVLVLGGLRLGAHKTLLTVPVELGLLRWSRCAELTCDRASLLVTRDLQATLRMLMTLAAGRSPGTTRRTETSLAAYIRQARSLALEEATSVTEGLLAAFLTLGVSHPFAPWRVMHLIEWVERGSYLDILAGHYERRRPDAFTAPWSWEIATWDLLGAVDFPEP